MKIEWLNDDLTRARVTIEADDSHWWRRKYVTAEVYLDKSAFGISNYLFWKFTNGDDHVYKHDSGLARTIDRDRSYRSYVRSRRARIAARAALKDPWEPVPEPTKPAALPPAKALKR